MNYTENLKRDYKNHVQNVDEILKQLRAFHKDREDTYQMSFAKRGHIGIWMNLVRKTDRLDGLMGKIVQGEPLLQTLIDTLVDICLYAVKWLEVIRHDKPEAWESWLDNNVK